MADNSFDRGNENCQVRAAGVGVETSQFLALIGQDMAVFGGSAAEAPLTAWANPPTAFAPML